MSQTQNKNTPKGLQFFFASTLVLLLAIGQFSGLISLQNFIQTEASGGNINPTRICSSNGYSQSSGENTDIPTAFVSNISLNVDQEYNFSNTTFSGAFLPTLLPTQIVSKGCLQSLPTNGILTNNSFSVPISANSDGYEVPYNFLKYTPNRGFKGVECFDLYHSYQGENFGNNFRDTNVVQLKIQVGTTSETCGPDSTTTSSCSSSVENQNSVIIADQANSNYLNTILGTVKASAQSCTSCSTSSSSVIVDNVEVTLLNNIFGGIKASAQDCNSPVSGNVIIISDEPKITESSSSSETSQSSSKPNLKITDPFECGVGITGNVQYDGKTEDLNPILLILTSDIDTNKIIRLNPTLNSSFQYSVADVEIPVGSYNVKYEISDKLGNKASDTYKLTKTESCNKLDTLSLNKIVKSGLTRSGGIETISAAIICFVLAFYLLSTLNQTQTQK